MNRHFALLPVAAATLLAAPAHGASIYPFYVGVSETVTRENNVFNAPSSGPVVADTSYATGIRAGVNQTFSRQEVYASGSVANNRYQDNKQLNYTGYSLGTGLNWATIGRLSGALRLSADRSLAKYDNGIGGTLVTSKNLQTSRSGSASAKLGTGTRLSWDASVNRQVFSFSAPEFAYRESEQTGASAGASYEFSGALTGGTGVTVSKTRYPNALAGPAGLASQDNAKRRDIYLSASWIPSGASSLNGRLAFGKTEYERASQRDVDGVTGSVNWSWQPTGKLRWTTSLSRDTGTDIRSDSTTSGALLITSTSDSSRVTDSLLLGVSYEATAKIGLSANAGVSRRELVDTRTVASSGASSSSERTDNTHTYSLNASWNPTRVLALGCNARRESRSGADSFSSSYNSTIYSCYGQFTLQ